MSMLRPKIRQTIRNVGRLKEILSVFAKNGLSELIGKMKLKIPGLDLPDPPSSETLEKRSGEDFRLAFARRLRKSFEELGPSFVKLGQLLSTRDDLLDEVICQELRKLLTSAKGIPFSEVSKIIESGLGPVEEIFEHIEKGAIGTASIGVVYKARLKNGKDVVVKIRRPGIAQKIQTDFSLLLYFIDHLERVSRDIHYLGISRILRDFESHLVSELDFFTEGINAQRLKKLLYDMDGGRIFRVPEVYKEYTRENILVMEFLEGTSFRDLEGPLSNEFNESLIKGVRLFTQGLLEKGLFHADLHPGNLLWLPEKKIGLLDFGLIGYLGSRARTNLIALLTSLLSSNYENLVYEFLNVASTEEIPNVEALIDDVRDALFPYVGLSLKETDFPKLMKSLMKTLAAHKIFLPRDWILVFRALMTLDGVGKTLDLDMNIYELLREDIHKYMKSILSQERLLEEGGWFAREMIMGMRSAPRHFHWFMKKWSSKNYAFTLEHTGHQQEFWRLGQSILVFGLLFLMGVLILSGTLSYLWGSTQEHFYFTVVQWILSGVLLTFIYKTWPR